ncbi:hypothetical protein EUX98_g1393 [Antrodiella citrinella]|uniref:Uncharacterized protein n=1 Tax=Antrodiella citrinella TaxID=2447956 RepID=A0A4V3XJF2_9APHY|nr:hypothetical protein EUX98_g1393 [Antrodiella citrinella]
MANPAPTSSDRNQPEEPASSETSESPELAGLVASFVLTEFGSPDGKKRKADSDMTTGVDFGDFGRVYCRLGEPGFYNIYDVVEHGLRMEAEDDDREDEDFDESEDLMPLGLTEEEQLIHGGWLLLKRRIPGFKKAMLKAVALRSFRRKICGQIQTGVQDQRSDDTGSLKYDILRYLSSDPSISCPIPHDSKLKSLRGWTDPLTSTLLTPLELEANKDTWDAITTGHIRVTADQWPRFCYPEGRQYMPDNEEEGLFKGFLLVRVAKHILTGPHTALKGPGGGGKGCNARRIGMTGMTPQVLAYVAIQTRFNICDVQDWDRMDRDFDLSKFWWNIVSFFEDGEGTEILEFYNRELFGGAHSLQGMQPGAAGGPTVSAKDRMRAERAAKRARIEQSPGPSS